MYIISKDNMSIINTEHVQTLYIGADGCTIKATLNGGNGCQLGKYASEEECKTVIDIIAGNLTRTGVCYMPDEKSISAKINSSAQKQYHISGKKRKGHGGS